MEQRSPTFNEKPLKLSSYWANDEQFKDDGTCSLENVNGLRRLVANLRNKRNKLLVKFNSLKHDSLKEIKRLEGKIAFLQGQLKQEKDKRVDVQLQKIEQSSALYETINEKASKINHLKLKINEI
jgi:deoxyribodipyrimidine photolyase